ncbi:MAG: YIP1 family protein [Armatimonadetes bacterium]|nr:YIP1 family protein [Armatimonadota bacterium]MBI2973780.1 YIP1 family protein [Armatimonadota bacterium]
MALADRMIRAARLDAALYEEVEADPTLTGQAVGVVILAAVAAGIGGAVRAGLGGLVAIAAAALISWYIWAYLTYWIGTRLLPEAQTQADVGQMMRTIGFSSSPGLVRVAGVIPGLTALAFVVGNIWMLVAMVIAVRQALDYRSTWRAVGVVAIGWIVHSLTLGVLLRLLRAA